MDFWISKWISGFQIGFLPTGLGTRLLVRMGDCPAVHARRPHHTPTDVAEGLRGSGSDSVRGRLGAPVGEWFGRHAYNIRNAH